MNINLIGPLKSDLSEVNSHDFTIFVDGGLNFKDGFNNYISVGDSDSTSLKHDIQLDPVKDESDYFHALKQIPPKTKNIFAHGLYGGRLDHQLFILGETETILIKNNFNFFFFHDNNLRILAFSKGKHEFSAHGNFSLFSFTDQKILLTGDCKYKITGFDSKIPKLSSRGLSNIGHGKVELSCESPIFVLFPQEEI